MQKMLMMLHALLLYPIPSHVCDEGGGVQLVVWGPSYPTGTALPAVDKTTYYMSAVQDTNCYI